MKPPYWLYLETSLEKSYLEQLVRWDYMNKLLKDNNTNINVSKSILRKLEIM